MASKPRPVKVSEAKKAQLARDKAAKLARSGKYSKAVKVVKEANKTKSRRMTKTEKIAIAQRPFVPKIVPQPPSSQLSDKGLSVKKLMQSTPRLMRENSYDCYAKTLKRGKTRKGLPVCTARVQHKDPERPNKIVRFHECMFVGLDDPFKPIHKQKRVMVSCSCENFVYVWEYANALHGASRIVYGNGEPPAYTNPSNQPGLCKHTYKLAQILFDEGI